MDTSAAAVWSDNEFMPLILVPEGVLEDGGHHVVDAEGALLCRITGDQERAERFVATANSHDALVKALQSWLDEFGDYHYYSCPADLIDTHPGHGPCNCFVGALRTETRDTLLLVQKD